MAAVSVVKQISLRTMTPLYINRGNTLKRFMGFYLTTKARIWSLDCLKGAMVAWPKSQTPLQLQRPMPTFSSPVATHAQSPFLRVNFPKETHQSQQVGATKRGEEDNFRGGCSIRRGLTPKSLNPDPRVHKQLQRPMPTFSSPVATHAQSPRLSTYSPILAQVPTPRNRG